MIIERTLSASPRRSRGASLIELLLTLPPLLLLGLGVTQLALIYSAKNTVNHAVFMAARAGSVNQADADAIHLAFGQALAPLHNGRPNYDRSAYRLHLLNPTVEAFSEYGEYIDQEFVIPNDRLHLRPADAGSSGVSIQDANRIKVYVLYGLKLDVPFVNRFILALARINASAQARALIAQGRLPILATATTLMQSHARPGPLVLSRAQVAALAN